ncbi:MAG: hypothetical protein F6K21_02210 [Symploca sp. SIO2D2]|nr:hypothetical protein [Symploca sp. SIO2D2]
MTQATLTEPLTELSVDGANESYSSAIKSALVHHHDLKALNKTRIRFKIGLKNATRRTSPKWRQILGSASPSQGCTNSNDTLAETKSDLEKITKSEVGLRGISVFKALDEAASQLRNEITLVKEWMTKDNGDYLCSLELAPLVWSRMLHIRDVLAPALRADLQQQYEQGYLEFQERVEEFFSAKAWNLDSEARDTARTDMLKQFPQLEELEEYLQVVIGRPVIIPSLSEQMSEQQAECLNQITRFIEVYDKSLEQNLAKAAIAGGQKLAAELLEDLATWEPGKKPVKFKKRIAKQLQKIRVLMGNAQGETAPTLTDMMAHLESILETASVDAKKLDASGKSQLQQKMDEISLHLLGEQQKLLEIAEAEGLDRSDWVVFGRQQ